MDTYTRYNRDWYLISRSTKKIYKIIKRYPGGATVFNRETKCSFTIFLPNLEQYYQLKYIPLRGILEKL